ncbi:MAG: hypothetical protein WC700_10440 [Gemmatimonadaceae bacterium]
MTQIRASDRDVAALEVDLLNQIIIVVDIKGGVRCIPLSRSLGFELHGMEPANADV